MANDGERTERLTRVRIEGFRSIAYANLELRDVNVFVGANGAGKSNFVGFLQMVGAMMREGLPRYVNEQRGANALMHFGSRRTGRILGELVFGVDIPQSLYRFDLFAIAGDRLLVDHEVVLYQNEEDTKRQPWYFGAAGQNSVIPEKARDATGTLEGEICRTFERRLSEVKIFHFHDSLATSPMRSFQHLADNRSLMGKGENTAVMLMRLRLEPPRTYHRIRDEMRQILPGFDAFVLEPEPSRGMEQVELRWVSKDSDYVLSPDQLSDGSIRAVSLLTLLLQPDEWKPSIVVIDEPELGLHPYAVGRIGRLIAEAGTTRQVIVSTQSPGLVAQFEPEDVVVVESERGASTFRRLDRETLGPWLEAYDGDLGRLFEMNVTGGAPE